MRTLDDCVRAAWEALLHGDLVERDRQIALARNLVNAAERMKSGGPMLVGEPICVTEEALGRKTE